MRRFVSKVPTVIEVEGTMSFLGEKKEKELRWGGLFKSSPWKSDKGKQLSPRI
jgi:hypothetical protein